MLTDQTARIASGCTGLAAEACGICRIADRKLIIRDDIVAVHIGYRYLCGRNQILIRVLQMIHILCKLRQLTGSGHGCDICDERRQNLGVAVLGMGVQEVVDNCSLQTGAHALVEVEAAAGDLCCGLRIQNAQILADIPVCLRLERKLLRLTPAAHLRIERIVRTLRYLVCRYIRNGKQNLTQLVLDLGALGIQLLDGLRECLHLSQNVGDILSCLLALRDLLGYLILLCLHGFHTANQITALLIQCQNAVNFLIVALSAHCKARLYLFRIFADKLYV